MGGADRWSPRHCIHCAFICGLLVASVGLCYFNWHLLWRVEFNLGPPCGVRIHLPPAEHASNQHLGAFRAATAVVSHSPFPSPPALAESPAALLAARPLPPDLADTTSLAPSPGPASTAEPTACLNCDVLDIKLPSTPGDWSIEGSCPLPRGKSGNASQVLARLLEAGDERCSGDACNTWIAYIGDSLLRAPFNHVIDLLLGRDWPLGGDRGVFNLTTYHVDHRVCCVVREEINAEEEIKALASPRLQCEFSRAFETVEYVRGFFRSRAGGGARTARNVCITWQWSRLADANLRAALSNYTGIAVSGQDGYQTTADKAAASPQLIVIDPGLHVIMSQQSVNEYSEQVGLLLACMRDIAAAQHQQQQQQPTRFVFQDITSVIDAHLPEKKRALLNETAVVRFNAILHERLSGIADTDSSARRWLRIVPAYRITAAGGGAGKGLVAPNGDGVHYRGGYSNIVAQLHLFFMGTDAPVRFCRP